MNRNGHTPAKPRKRRAGKPADDAVILRLYIAGQSLRSLQAVSNLRRFCETHLPGKYRIELIDLVQHPQLAAGDEIIAIPTLVRKLPTPIRKLIGDLSNEEKLLVGLQMLPRV